MSRILNTANDGCGAGANCNQPTSHLLSKLSRTRRVHTDLFNQALRSPDTSDIRLLAIATSIARIDRELMALSEVTR